MDISPKNKKIAKELIATVGESLDDYIKGVKEDDESLKKRSEVKLNAVLELALGSYLELMDMAQTQTLAMGSFANSFRAIQLDVKRAVDHYVSQQH